MFKFPTDKEVSIKFKSISRKPFSNLKKKNESLPDNLTKYQLENPTKNQLRIHQKSIRKSRKNLPKLEQKSSVSPPSNSTKNQQKSSEKVTALNRDQYSTYLIRGMHTSQQTSSAKLNASRALMNVPFDQLLDGFVGLHPTLGHYLIARHEEQPPSCLFPATSAIIRSSYG